MDENDEPVTDEGDVGDICVKGPALMLGYLNNKKATREALDDNGWLRTGDVGQIVDGKVFIVDRKKDLIKVRGWQVSPAEVESVVLEHPDVIDAAVVGVDLGTGAGEVPRAYVVLRNGCENSEADIKSFVGKSLARYKIPEQVVFVSTIPKNPTGKILRRVLRAEAAQADKAEAAESIVLEGKALKPWPLVAVFTVRASKASKSLSRFFSWLRGLLLPL